MINKSKPSLTFMKWARDLFPFCRSLTGEGNRQTLKYIKSVNSKFIIKFFKSNKKVLLFDSNLANFIVLNFK